MWHYFINLMENGRTKEHKLNFKDEIHNLSYWACWKGRVQQEAVAYLERALIEVTHLTAGRDRCIGISQKKPT